MPSKQSISYRFAGISILSCAGSCLPLTIGLSVFDVSSSNSIPKSKHRVSNSSVVYLQKHEHNSVRVEVVPGPTLCPMLCRAQPCLH